MKLVLIVHDVRSALNVGSLLRTADGLGVDKVYFTGYSPYPEVKADTRLPHVRLRASNQIRKTALGAEDSVNWTHQQDIFKAIDGLRKSGFTIAALEQSANSTELPKFISKKPLALIVGNEVDGLGPEILNLIDIALEIPMLGAKESYNVASAGAMALYHLRFIA